MDDAALLSATDCGPETATLPCNRQSQTALSSSRSPALPEDRSDPAYSRPAEDGAVLENGSATDAPAASEDEPNTVPALARVVEALLFAADAPLNAVRLADLACDEATPALIRAQIAALNDKYEQIGLSFRIEAIARGYQMMTLPAYRPWLAKLNNERSKTRLTDAALETLSIIAYKQPIIRAEIESIRGVSCGDGIGRLREMGLVRVIGRAEVVGRPLLYGTTKKFLATFGLADLKDLPQIDALKLKPAAEATSKPVEDVEPVKPARVEEPRREQRAVAGS